MAAPRPLTDSPWFWAHLFGLAALAALLLATPKYDRRQVHIERQFQGRQRATQQLRGQTPDVELSSEGRPFIPLTPLFLGLAAATVVTGILAWRSRAASSSQPETEVPSPTVLSDDSSSVPRG